MQSAVGFNLPGRNNDSKLHCDRHCGKHRQLQLQRDFLARLTLVLSEKEEALIEEAKGKGEGAKGKERRAKSNT